MSFHVIWRSFPGSQLFWSLVLETPWILGLSLPFFPSPPLTLALDLFKTSESIHVILVWDQNMLQQHLTAFLAILHHDVLPRKYFLFEPSQRYSSTDFLWSSVYSTLSKQHIQIDQSPVNQMSFRVAWQFGNSTFEWMNWNILLWWHCPCASVVHCMAIKTALLFLIQVNKDLPKMLLF